MTLASDASLVSNAAIRTLMQHWRPSLGRESSSSHSFQVGHSERLCCADPQPLADLLLNLNHRTRLGVVAPIENQTSEWPNSLCLACACTAVSRSWSGSCVCWPIATTCRVLCSVRRAIFSSGRPKIKHTLQGAPFTLTATSNDNKRQGPACSCAFIIITTTKTTTTCSRALSLSQLGGDEAG